MNATIKVNEKPVPWKSGTTLFQLRRQFKPDADILVYNGFPVDDDREIQANDRVTFIRRGEAPDADEIRNLMISRHSPEVYDKINKRTVGIAGVGGLGSSLAIALARLCIGRVIIADFDVVEPSNLNRQQYFIDQIGMLKVDALKENLFRINPNLVVDTHSEKVDRKNIIGIYRDCDVLAECFDNPESKSEFVEFALREWDKPVVAVSGIAGYRDADKLRCRKALRNLYMIGDGVTAAAPGSGLMAPKVGIAAHLQANKILEILLDM